MLIARSLADSGAIWQHQVVETRADLLASWPVLYPPHGDDGLWDGLTPGLALNGAGKAPFR